MSYSIRRQQYHVILKPTRTAADVLFEMAIPAGRSVDVYDLKAQMSTAGSAAGCAVDLKLDGATAAMTVITANSTGTKVTASARPQNFAGAVGGSKLQLIQNTTDTSGIGTCILDMDAVYQ